jgi:hypothetical protein
MEVRRIMRIIEDARRRVEANLPLVNSEIDWIIQSNNQSVQTIEHLLDAILDYSYLGIGEYEFKKLNDYYHTFNPDNAREYSRFYQELKGD